MRVLRPVWAVTILRPDVAGMRERAENRAVAVQHPGGDRVRFTMLLSGGAVSPVSHSDHWNGRSMLPEDLQDVLWELGRRLGVDPLDLDRQGGCLVVFDDMPVEIAIADEAPGFFLTGPVGPAPGDGRESAFAELLEANLQHRGTQRACLALDRDLDEIELCRYYDRDRIDIETLEIELDGFLRELSAWRARLGAGALGGLTISAGDAEAVPAGAIRG